MKCIPTTILLTSAVASLFGTVSASAQNANFATGDLVIYFQKFGGGNTVYANLGNAATIYRGTAAGPGAPNSVNFLNLNTALTSAFGAGWASNADVYAGLAGVWGTSNTSSILQDSDPHRTLYVSNSRTGVGTVGQANSSAWNLVTAGTGAMTSAATNIFTQNNVLEVSFDEAVEVVSVAASQIDNQNPFVNQDNQDTAFNTFAGGVQQRGTVGSFGSFGAAGNVEFALDLYRILARNNIVGQVAGDLRIGSYEGTVTVNSSGQVSFISQGASTPYDTWMATFPTITAPADKLETADPDGDGFKNLMEFVLNGNPSVSNTSIAPTLDASGTNFMFNFNRRDDSESPETTLVFQHSTDLVTWTDVSIGAGTSGVVTVNENGAAADGIIVTIPKGVNTKLFGRLKVVR